MVNRQNKLLGTQISNKTVENQKRFQRIFFIVLIVIGLLLTRVPLF